MNHSLKKYESYHIIKPLPSKFSIKSRNSEPNCQTVAYPQCKIDKVQTKQSQKQQQTCQAISNMSKEVNQQTNEIYYLQDEIHSQDVYDQQSEYVPDVTKSQQKYETEQINQLLHSLSLYLEQIFFKTEFSPMEQNSQKDRYLFFVARMAIKQQNTKSSSQQIIEYGEVELNFEEKIKESYGSNQTYYVLQNQQKENPISINIQQYQIYVNRFKPWIVWLMSKIQSKKIILLQFETIESTDLLLNSIGLQKTSQVRFQDFFILKK